MSSLAGRRLTDAHRTAQARISAQTVARLVQVWPLLDVTNLDATAARWLTAALPIIQQGRATSASVAATYLRQFRSIETGDPTPPTIIHPGPADRAIRTSLLVTGPIAIKAAMTAGTQLEQAARTASFTSSMAGARQALNAGRDLLVETTRQDPRASGLVRVASPGACDFCQEIADYSETNPALLGDFQCHDGCHCQPEPAY